MDSSLVSARERDDGLSCRLLTVVRVEARQRAGGVPRRAEAGQTRPCPVGWPRLTGDAADLASGFQHSPVSTAPAASVGRADVTAALSSSLRHRELGLRRSHRRRRCSGARTGYPNRAWTA